MNNMSSCMKHFAIVLFVILALFFSCRGTYAATITSVDDTTVSVGIGNEAQNRPPSPEDNKRFSIYGNTSPGAKVVIQNPGIHSETYANADGVYEFKYLFLSLFREDICIVATDTDNRTTPPLCIPPPPNDLADRRIGPVLLPPSTSISAGNAYIGDTVTLTGQTIPNADVKLSLYTDELKQNKTLTFIPSVYAYSLPQLSLNSDKRGQYSLTLPTASSQFIRMFTRALHNGQSTPKGLTLVLDVFPLWMILLKFFSTFFSLLKAHLLELIILIQLYILLMYFLKHFFKPEGIRAHRKGELMRRHMELGVLPHEIIIQTQTTLMLREVSLVLLSNK